MSTSTVFERLKLFICAALRLSGNASNKDHGVRLTIHNPLNVPIESVVSDSGICIRILPTDVGVDGLNSLTGANTDLEARVTNEGELYE